MSDQGPAQQGDDLRLQESAATDIVTAVAASVGAGFTGVQAWAAVRTMSASTLEPTYSAGFEDDLEYRPGPDAEYRVGPEAFGVYDWDSDL
jgi:hypothetical protein